jgi:site-specific DNA recombinase
LLTPDRVRGLLPGLMKRQAEKNVDLVDRLTALRGKLADAENRLKRFYEHIEAGSLDSSDPTLKDRVAVAKKERDIAQVTLDRAAG